MTSRQYRPVFRLAAVPGILGPKDWMRARYSKASFPQKVPGGGGSATRGKAAAGPEEPPQPHKAEAKAQKATIANMRVGETRLECMRRQGIAGLKKRLTGDGIPAILLSKFDSSACNRTKRVFHRPV